MKKRGVFDEKNVGFLIKKLGYLMTKRGVFHEKTWGFLMKKQGFS